MVKSVYIRLNEDRDRDLLSAFSKSTISNPQLIKALARYALNHIDTAHSPLFTGEIDMSSLISDTTFDDKDKQIATNDDKNKQNATKISTDNAKNDIKRNQKRHYATDDSGTTIGGSNVFK